MILSIYSRCMLYKSSKRPIRLKFGFHKIKNVCTNVEYFVLESQTAGGSEGQI